MGLFDNLDEKLQNVTKKSVELAQSAAKKSGDMMEIAKLNYKIKEEESLIKETYLKLGKMIYEQYCNENDVPDDMLKLVNLIKQRKNEISILNCKIQDIKDNCNVEITDDDFVKDNKYTEVNDIIEENNDDEDNKL